MKQLKSIVEWCTALFFSGLVLVTLLQVVARYVFNNPFSWTEELARYLFIWTTLLAAALAVERGVHMGLDVVLVALPARLRAGVSLFNHLVVTVFLLYLIVKGYELAIEVMGNPSVALEVPMGWPYLAVPVGGVLMVIFNLRHIRDALVALLRPALAATAEEPVQQARYCD